QHDRSHKPWGEANGSAQCGKSACCVRRGGGWNRGTAEILGHSPTKGRDNGEPKLQPKPARQSSTLPMSGVWKRGQGRTSEAPPDERGGNRYVRPNATARHLDATKPPRSGARTRKPGVGVCSQRLTKRLIWVRMPRPALSAALSVL